MAQFTEEEFIKLASLSRIECSSEEKDKLFQSLKQVLDYVDQLQEVDTEGVTPCNHVLENCSLPLREDMVKDLLPKELFLANAPAHTGGMIRVPPILKSGEEAYVS